MIQNMIRGGSLAAEYFASTNTVVFFQNRPSSEGMDGFVEKIDAENGIIHTPFIDAEDGTPVLDIKPYFPMERIRQCQVPEWFAHWPEWAEDAIHFDWKKEINFP